MTLLGRLSTLGSAILLVGSLVVAVSAQQPYQKPQWQTRRMVNQIDNRTHTFVNILSSALNRSDLNGSARENEINNAAQSLVLAADSLKTDFDINHSTRADAESVMQRARELDVFMRQNHLGASVESNWRMLHTELDQMARNYNVAWNWNENSTMPVSEMNQFAGTWHLNRAMSDSSHLIAQRALANGNLPATDRDRIYNNLSRRLDAPESLAIDKVGNEIKLASTKSPEVMLEANGHEYLVTYPNGKTSHVRASVAGNTLTVVANGNRMNDFTATFEPIDNGQRLRVTREMFAERLNQPVRVQSYYDRSSAIADFNIFQPARGQQAHVDFIIPNDTSIVATLNTNLDTRTLKDFDSFTMTVRQPRAYRNAVIEGHVSDSDRSGRLAGRARIQLNFDRIRMPDGRTYAFAGMVEGVRAFNGQDVRIDNEGSIADRETQTTTTAERSAIGGAVGALIGAIAGGGEGAAVGAAVGAGVGAGSVYVRGRDDLEMPMGTQFTIRASGPNRL